MRRANTGVSAERRRHELPLEIVVELQVPTEPPVGVIWRGKGLLSATVQRAPAPKNIHAGRAL